MRCRTHIVLANSLMLLIGNPNTSKELFVSLGACTLGSVISDLDIRTSNFHKTIDAITIFSFVITLIAYYIDIKYNYGIFSILKNGIMFLPMIGLLLLLGVLFYGSHQPHRSFLHSFLGISVLSFIMYFFFGNIWYPFFIGIVSHVFIDLFNMKSVRLFYPSKKGFCLKLCEYGGLVDNILFYSSIILIVLMLFYK